MSSDIRLKKNWLDEYPQDVRLALKKLAGRCRELYVTGGAVRDWLGDSIATDLDFSVAGDGIAAARFFSAETGGTFVLLNEQEGVARVVVDNLSIDISSFREGTTNIIDDLALRDFSINAMAVAIDSSTGTLLEPFSLIDPLAGAIDYKMGLIRSPSINVFKSDPLRLLRAYRFAACLSFKLEAQTELWMQDTRCLVAQPAPERVRYELDLIMNSDRAAKIFEQMNESSFLGLIFPELLDGDGLEQPASHHLDVFGHNMAALVAIESIIADPAFYFRRHPEHFHEYLLISPNPMLLKWAALFHDLGKPETCKTRKDGRTTFYNHDRVGADIFLVIARRLCWSRDNFKTVARLIELHMYPFHLSNSIKNTGITPRACLRLVKAAKGNLPGLFMLAMADSLASRGPLRPLTMEKDLASLYNRVDDVYRKSIEPVLNGPPLLTGNDLIGMGLSPGPMFGQIIDDIEQARVVGEIVDRDDAILRVREFISSRS